MVHLTRPSNSIKLILELEKRTFLFGVDKRVTAYRIRQKCFAIYLLIGWRRTFITYAERHFCNT